MHCIIHCHTQNTSAWEWAVYEDHRLKYIMMICLWCKRELMTEGDEWVKSVKKCWALASFKLPSPLTMIVFETVLWWLLLLLCEGKLEHHTHFDTSVRFARTPIKTRPGEGIRLMFLTVWKFHFSPLLHPHQQERLISFYGGIWNDLTLVIWETGDFCILERESEVRQTVQLNQLV